MTCRLPNCKNKIHARGLCKKHYRPPKEARGMQSIHKSVTLHNLTGTHTHYVHRHYVLEKPHVSAWAKLEKFIEDMGKCPLDRVPIRPDLNKPFSINNCFYGTKEERRAQNDVVHAETIKKSIERENQKYKDNEEMSK